MAHISRSQQAWFDALPHGAKAEYQRRWAAARSRTRGRHWGRVLALVASVGRGLLVFPLATVAFIGREPELVATAALAGAVVGLLWGIFSAGPLRSAVIAVPAYVAFAVASTDTTTLSLFAMVFAILLAAGLSITAGLVREWRVSDGRQ